MTSNYSPPVSVDTAKSEVGYHEQSGRNKFSPWQGLDSANPWCASFACYCAYVAGYRFPPNSTFGVKGEAYTPTMKLRAEQEGIWRDKWWAAKPGDFVEFDWGNNGLIDHVEVVIFDAGQYIYTIGGNTSDSVAYRKRDRTYVAGFVALSQSPQAKPVLTAAELAAIKKLAAWLAAVKKTPLEMGQHSNNVAILNQLLAASGFLTDTSHMNDYTPATRDAVVHFKKLHPELGNIVGKTFGAEAATVILKPR